MHHGAELSVVLIAALALAIGAGLRLFSRWSGFPYTIAMLLVGILVGLGLDRWPGAHEGHGVPHMLLSGAAISPDLIIFVFLPALVFESAYAIDVHTFRKNVGAVVVLAGPALILSTVAVAALMMGLTGGFAWNWGWAAALVFGALISATDPVAVVAILRELGVSKRLGVLIEGESLLNDGTSIVVFTVLLAMLTGEQTDFSTVDALVRFVIVVSGGLAVGIGLALLLSTWIERLFNDPLSEITLTLVLAYLAMIIAEGLLHVSGVMAVVAAGLWMSGTGKTKISPEVSHFLHRFWETLGYIANTLIFFLVGLVISTQIGFARPSDFLLIVVVYVGVMAIRFVLTYAFMPIADRLSDGVSFGDSAVISWGGLRGAVSLALGLIVSQHPDVDPVLRRQILLVTAGVVLLTILVNGTTIGKLLARLGYDKPPLSEQLAHLTAKAMVLERVHEEIQEASRSRDLRTVPWGEVERANEERRQELAVQIESTRKMLDAAPAAERAAGYWRRVLAIERQVYWESYALGTLGPSAVKLLSRELDRQLDRLARGDLEPPETRTPSDAATSRFLGGGSTFDRLALVFDLSRAESLASEKVLGQLDSLRGVEGDVSDAIRRTYQRYLRLGKERIEDMRTNLPELASAIETRLARRIELNFEREGYERLAERGVLDEATAQAELDSVETRMQKLRRGATRVPIPETAELVASTPLFSSLDAAALEELAELTEEMVVPAGEYLFREGDKGDSMFVIARGALHVIVTLDDEDVVVDVLGGGDIIGEMSLLTGAPRTASARAATSVTLGKVSLEAFEHLMQTQPALRDNIWKEFAKRTFDNHVRGQMRFSHLDHDRRLGWFDLGKSVVLSAGESVAVEPEHDFLFVLTGRVRVEGREHDALALVDVAAAQQVEGVDEARVTLLPSPLTESTVNLPERTSLSSAGMKDALEG